MSDQVRFLTENQRVFYENMIRFFRRDLGVESLISCSNWHTADPTVLDPLERYTYTAGDVIDRHGYFGGTHQGPRASYAVDVGDTFSDRAGVLEPTQLPLFVNQVADYPHIISEIGWPNPNRFKAEFPFLCAAYGSLQGVDGYCFFAVSGSDWDSSVRKFPVMVPTVLGQFPALALMYRRGDVREADPVVREEFALEDLFGFKGSQVAASQNLDELRRADLPAASFAKASEPSPIGLSAMAQGRRRANQATRTPVSRIDPLCFCVGRVLRSFDAKRSTCDVSNLETYIDRAAKTVRSVTNELAWNYGKGVVTVNTPRSQGVTGFLGATGPVDLEDVVIESANEFGTIVVISLDDKPIAHSDSVLIQAMTEEKPFGWKVEGDRIVRLGGYPLNVRNIEATVTLKGQRNRKARVLNANGYERGEAVATSSGAGLKVVLPADALYTVVSPEPSDGG